MQAVRLKNLRAPSISTDDANGFRLIPSLIDRNLRGAVPAFNAIEMQHGWLPVEVDNPQSFHVVHDRMSVPRTVDKCYIGMAVSHAGAKLRENTRRSLTTKALEPVPASRTVVSMRLEPHVQGIDSAGRDEDGHDHFAVSMDVERIPYWKTGIERPCRT